MDILNYKSCKVTTNDSTQSPYISFVELLQDPKYNIHLKQNNRRDNK